MKLLWGINIVFLAVAGYGFARGFGLHPRVSTLPLGLVVAGVVAGLFPFRICAAANAICAVAGAFALWFGAVIAAGGGALMLMGGSKHEIDDANGDATLLLLLGLIALVSGCVAARQLVKRANPYMAPNVKGRT